MSYIGLESNSSSVIYVVKTPVKHINIYPSNSAVKKNSSSVDSELITNHAPHFKIFGIVVCIVCPRNKDEDLLPHDRRLWLIAW